MGQGHLVPALALDLRGVDDVADEFGVAAAFGADGFGERFAVLEIRGVHVGLEGEEVEHRHGIFPGGLGEGGDPGLKVGRHLEGLGGVADAGAVEGAGEGWGGSGMEDLVVLG